MEAATPTGMEAREDTGSYTQAWVRLGTWLAPPFCHTAGEIRFRFWSIVLVSERGPCWTEKGDVGLPFLLNIGIGK